MKRRATIEGTIRLVPLASLFVCLLVGSALLAAELSENAQKPGLLSDKPNSDTAVWIMDQWRAEQAFLRNLIAEKRKLQEGPADYVYHPQATIFLEDRDPTDVVLRRARALLEEIRRSKGAPDLGDLDKSLGALEREVRPGGDGPQRDRLFFDICAIRRKIAFANPVLQFDEIVFMYAEMSYHSHASANGAVSDGRMVWGHAGDLSRGSDRIPRHLSARVGYLSDDLQFPPNPASDDLQFSHPRFRSQLYDKRTGSLPRMPRGLMALSNFRNDRPQVRALFENTRVESGPFAGAPATAGLFCHDWDLDYDGKRAVFAWFCAKGLGEPAASSRNGNGGRCQLYTANLDGSAMKPLTDDIWINIDPCFLPDGRIVFRSSRRMLYDRCDSASGRDGHGPGRNCATLFSIGGDGADCFPLSWHETTEYHPSVDNDGRLIYSRWDYIDRGFSAAHHMWHCYPDGRDPRAIQGNYGLPLYRGDPPADTNSRSMGQFHPKAIPGVSGKYIVIDGGHHACLPGSPLIVDLNRPDDHNGGPSRRILDVELCGDTGGGAGMATPWPLNDTFFLVSAVSIPKRDRQRAVAHEGIYLLDKFGNLEVLFTDKQAIEEGLSNLGGFGNMPKSRFNIWGPRPRIARPRPPIIPTATFQGERQGATDHKRATIAVMNVYDADFSWPEGRTPTELRVVQCWGRPWFRPSNWRPSNYSDGSLGRMALGRAPIEKDGSAHFEAPVGCEVYFQVLDQHGMAIQSMRTGTYVHPGEQLSCAGCHEDKWKRNAQTTIPLAMRRPPSKLQPEVGGPYPQTHARLVKPLFEGKCIACHKKENKGPIDLGYKALQPLASGSYYGNGGAGSGNDSGSRSTPGKIGAAASPLGKMLLTTHLERLAADERRRVTLWLDMCAQNICDFRYEEDQLLGRIVWPWGEGDSANPLHVEHDRPLANNVIPPDGLEGALRLLHSSEWQARQWGAESLRQLGSAAAGAKTALRKRFTEAITTDRIEETDGLLRAFRAIDPGLYAEAVSELCAVAGDDDPSRAFRACEAMKFAGADTPDAVATLVRVLKAEHYEPAVSAGEALVALDPKVWSSNAMEILPALQSPHPRVGCMTADLLRRLGRNAPAGTAAALARTLRERSHDFTFLGNLEKLERSPEVKERLAWFSDVLYGIFDRRDKRGLGRTDITWPCSPLDAIGSSLERSRDREMMTMCARALAVLGPEAKDAAPALAHCASLDAGDQMVLVDAAVKIAPLETVQSAAELLAGCRDNEDKLTQLVFFIALIGEKGGTEACAAAMAALVGVKGQSYAAQEAAKWCALLGGAAQAPHAKVSGVRPAGSAQRRKP